MTMMKLEANAGALADALAMAASAVIPADAARSGLPSWAPCTSLPSARPCS